jgi:hypothetical protein
MQLWLYGLCDIHGDYICPDYFFGSYLGNPLIVTEAEPNPSGKDISIVNQCSSDSDEDGIPDNLDNCPTTPNQDQLDDYPPQGNSCGNACECEGNFNGSEDQDVDGSDAFTFKVDFGRSIILHPCIAGDACNGDFSCDGDVDGTDAFTFKSDFGRSSILNPCPSCISGVEWCEY